MVHQSCRTLCIFSLSLWCNKPLIVLYRMEKLKQQSLLLSQIFCSLEWWMEVPWEVSAGISPALGDVLMAGLLELSDL